PDPFAGSLYLAPMGATAPAERVLLAKDRNSARALSTNTHHPCLGSQRGLPYSADRGKQSVTRRALDELKQQIPLMEYLQAHDWRGLRSLLHEAAGFYRMQLHRHAEAVAYLCQRGICSPEVIEHMRIGYAPGGCLRGWLTQLGYPVQALRQAGLVTAAGYDTY